MWDYPYDVCTSIVNCDDLQNQRLPRDEMHMHKRVLIYHFFNFFSNINIAQKTLFRLEFQIYHGFLAYGGRKEAEELFSSFVKTGQLLEAIVAECLGLPSDFLKKFSDDRNCDFMVALRYFLATDDDSNGLSEHEDGNIITLVLQDEVGGLEVRKNGEWIPVTPTQGTLVVNLGDVVQVRSACLATTTFGFFF